MSEPIDETIELNDTDAADVAKLYAVPEDEAPNFHSILEVWEQVLRSADSAKEDQITPQWCSKIVGKYAGVTFADCGVVHETYFDLLIACHKVTEWVIEKDPAALGVTTPEDDKDHNSTNYFNVLLLWQMTFLSFELDWDWGDPNAAADLAAIGEAHNALFGQLGLTAYLDNIQFEFNDSDQELMLELLNEMKEG